MNTVAARTEFPRACPSHGKNEDMRPQVVAHRGASFENPEHTLRAYLEAIRDGADALECDVRLTADGHLVCVHDRDLRRTASATGLVSHDGAGRSRPARVRVVEEPVGRLRRRGRGPDPDLVRVLTLRRLFETVADADRRIELAIETKHPTRFGGLVERRLAELLAEFGWSGKDSPGSGDELLLRRPAAHAEACSAAPAGDADRQGAALAGAQADGRGAVDARPWDRRATKHPKFAAKMAESGRDLHVWTVNTEEQLDLCTSLGVRAVITDRPRAVLGWLQGVPAA